MHIRRWIAVLLCLPLLLGSRCAVLGPGEDSSDLREARKRWEAAGIDDYTFDLRRICFCAIVDPVRIVVRNGQPVSHTVIATGEPLPPEERHLFPTVDGLFDFVDEAIHRDAHRIEARYDPRRGFPIEVFVDYEENVADEEMGYAISAFTVQ